MASITLSIPPNIKEKMSEFPEINWSGLIKKLLEAKIKELIWKEEMLEKLEKDKEFENWTIEMGEKVNKNIAKKIEKNIK